jgi:glycosyltransferase 2 family protein
MKKRLFTILKYLLFLGLGVFLVWWSLHQIPKEKWNDFKAAFATARYILLVPVFFILSASHMLRAWRWKMLMRPLGYNPSLANTFFAVMIGYMANLAVPRLGEVLKCTILAKYEKVPVQKLMGTIVAERAFDVVCLVIVFIFAFIFQFEAIGQYGLHLIKQFFQGKGGHFSIKKIAITISVVVVVYAVVRFILRRFLHIRVIGIISEFIQGIGAGIISIKYLQQKWAFIFSSLGIWAMYLLGTWIGFHATIGTAGLPFQIAVSALAFASIGMIITPGGIGAYAYFIAQVLEKNGISFEIGFANGTLQWFAQFIIILFVGFISLLLLPYVNKNKIANEKTRDYTV